MEDIRMSGRQPAFFNDSHPAGVLTRAQLAGWLDALALERILVAPRLREGVLLYQPVESSAELVWEFTRPVLPVKEFFFPPTERLMTIEKTGQQVRLVETLPGEHQVIFGVRPCEARGVHILDALFLDPAAKDPYYARRRENTAMIGLACREMGDTCFCTSTGSGPDDPSGVDVMLTEEDGGYRVEVVTEKGWDLLGDRLPESIFQENAYTNPETILQAFQPVAIPAAEDWPAHFDDPYWEQLGERCLSCRVCAYVCPTCRCFDLRDEALVGEGSEAQFERIRCWDSCTGPAYRRIAGGNNPRATPGQRLRNRFFCKFYYYPRQYGLASSACTGCGRCIDECPVNVDITEVLNHLAA
ncbi:MAG TPA: 4Fe-4S dicluster domain-containing protein [Anaerolineales bacterium]